MAYVLELSPEIEERVRNAWKNGIDVDAYLIETILTLPTIQRRTTSLAAPHAAMPMPVLTQPMILRHPTPEQEEASRYFAERAENPITDPDEIAQADKEFAELMQNLREWHQ